MNRMILGVALMAVLAPGVASAQSVITEQNVAAMYAALDQSRLKTASNQDIRLIFEKHSGPDFSVTYVITKDVPGRPKEEETLVMDRAEYIDRVVKFHESGGTDTAHTVLESVTIAPDGQSATATYILSATYSGPAGDKTMHGTQIHTCTDGLKLSPDAVVQVQQSACSILAKLRVVEAGEAEKAESASAPEPVIDTYTLPQTK